MAAHCPTVTSRGKRPGRIVVVAFLLVTSGCTKLPTPPQRALNLTAKWTPSLIQNDIPLEMINRTETAHLWLTNNLPTGQSVHINIFPDSQLDIQPVVLDMSDAKPQTIKIRRLNMKPSLASIIIDEQIGQGKTSTPHQTIHVMNLGLHPALKFSIPSQLDGGASTGFSVRTVDEEGKSISIPASVSILLRGVNVKFADGTANPENPLSITLHPGANSTPPLKVIPERVLSGGRGSVQAELIANDYNVIADSDPQEFTIPVALRLQFAMAIAGGLLNSLYATILLILDHGSENWRTLGARICIGVIAGILTVLFADKTAALGITLQTSSLLAYVASGFLVAYLGIDVFFARAKISGTSVAEHSKRGNSEPHIKRQPVNKNLGESPQTDET